MSKPRLPQDPRKPSTRMAHIVRAGARNTTDADKALERDAWETPWPTVHALSRYVFGDDHGFDLDVAASAGNAKAPRYFTREDDGLAALRDNAVYDILRRKQQMPVDIAEDGLRVWCNPPWSNIVDWLEAAWRWQADDPIYHTAVVLGPLSDTTVRWSIQRDRQWPKSRSGDGYPFRWAIVGDGRLSYVYTPTQKVLGGAGQSSIAWIFEGERSGKSGPAVLSDAELEQLTPRDGRVCDGLPLFGGGA